MPTTIPTTTPDTAAPFSEIPLLPDQLQLAAVDLYRDIHKGIRSELFAITSNAGSLDPSARLDRVAIAEHVVSVGAVLESHAHHEDTVIDPVLVEFAPALAERITADHEVLEVRFAGVVELAQGAVNAAAGDRRRLVHQLHLDLASFTSSYLAHQDLEERVVMPTLEQQIGPQEVLALHQAIVSSIPPDEMARSLAFMLPAMNVDDRVEMLTGIRASAPREAFGAVVDLARSVLLAREMSAIESRLALS